MKKEIEKWTVCELKKSFTRINFPEYQREPNIWSKNAKQRLIDSMLRQFDIAPLYFYVKENSLIDCVDGRQRIGAIMSFLEENQIDKDNGFEFKILNELYEDEDHPYKIFENKSYKDILNCEEDSEDFNKSINDYELTVVKLSDCHEYNEYNLQFARLNLGMLINSGEKLHAMVGDLRDVCFKRIGEHKFLELTNIPERRYAKEQTAAQILAQIFSYETTKIIGIPQFTRTRHFDLQRLFKEYTELNDQSIERSWIKRVKEIMDLLNNEGEKFKVIRSRALVVSTILLAYEHELNFADEASDFADFINQFVCRLRWQVNKGLDVDAEYRHLIEFQRHVIQGSVEKPAVSGRHYFLNKDYQIWKQSKNFSGDLEYKKNNPDKDPNKECQV